MKRTHFSLSEALLVYCAIAVTHACDLLAVNECTAILSQGTNISMNSGLSVIPSADILTKMCSSLDEFRACYDPKAAACANDAVFSMTFGTIKKTIDFLCGDGFDDIMHYANCWNGTEVIEGQAECHHNQTVKIALLQQRVGLMNTAEQRHHWCTDILKKTTECMVLTVGAECGAGPACIMDTMMNRALGGLVHLMRCPIPSICSMPVADDNDLSTVRPSTHDQRRRTKTTANAAEQKQSATTLIQLSLVFIVALLNKQ